MFTLSAIRLPPTCSKPATFAPSSLAHPCARDIRTFLCSTKLLSHADVSTTMIYTHVLQKGGRAACSIRNLRSGGKDRYNRPAANAAPINPTFAFITTCTGIFATNSAIRPLSRKARMKVPSVSLSMILGAMPPAM